MYVLTVQVLYIANIPDESSLFHVFTFIPE